MFSHVKADTRRQAGHGDFKIRIVLPGAALKHSPDPGLLTLGRFDDAHLKPGAFIGMHPHVNDEILTLMKQGTMLHRDNTGQVVEVTPHRIMMMNAGAGIYHEESIPANRFKEDVRLLQIFIRPERDDLPPRVQFADPGLPTPNAVRLIAGPTTVEAPLQIRSNTVVYDMELSDEVLSLPPRSFRRSTFLIYVFDGRVKVTVAGEHAVNMVTENVEQGDYMITDENESIRVTAEPTASLVIFELDQEGVYSTNGMYSGLH